MNLGQLRQAAAGIWKASLEAASPTACVRNAISWDGRRLVIAGEEAAPGKLIVIGAGKASAKMAQVAEDILGDRIAGGLIVTKYDHGLPLHRIRLLEAGHPLPDEAGVKAVREMRTTLLGLTPEDTVLCLMSGGGSALWPAPADGISLSEKQQVTSLLLRAGAGIRELNAVRKHLSAIKGGQLVRWAAPAQVVSLIMSDVIGDPLDFIASGPAAPDTTTFADALEIIQKYGIDVPAGVLHRIQAGIRGDIPDTPKPGDTLFDSVRNHIIANNRLLVEAAAKQAEVEGFKPLILSTEIEGEAREVARFFAAIGREAASTGHPVAGPACILGSGETTVTVKGKGIGGRNQEMALAWAMAIGSDPQVPCCFASVATDGTDGPTDAAGGLVDPTTLKRAEELGLSASQYLRANDSYHFLKDTGDLIVTGPTQTNLMDIQIMLIGD